jgi:glycine/D-amino acid oxidase-like deaminating enzyme
MSLRTGISYWQTLGLSPTAAPTLTGSLACEVAVLGGGVTGALIAHRLTQEGVDTVLVDKRPLGTGSTAASTGLLQYEIDTPLVELIAKVGESNAVHAYRRGLKAIDEIETLTEELQDRCGFVRRESLYFATHWWHRGRLKQEYECRKHHGFDVALLERGELAQMSSIGASAAIRSSGDAQIDPYRFTQRLLQRSAELGARLFAETVVTDIKETDQAVLLRTPHGTITAKHVVFAAGYDSYRYLPKKLGRLHSTYALASQPIPEFQGWPNHSLIWETARPYFYARQTDDGRAIIGGGDTAFSTDHQREQLLARKMVQLQQRFEQLFPGLKFVPACAWAGVFGESKDGLAYIGGVPARPRSFFAVGYGGNGITFSMIAARLITDLCLGRPNPDAAVFCFDR